MKKGLVFSGGGARGAYQLGVWKALNELDMKFDIVTGTSIGSLNGALYVQEDYKKAEELWFNVSPGDIVDTKEVDPHEAEKDIILKSFLGGISTQPLENLLKEHIDEKKIRESKIDFGIVVASFPIISTNYLTIQEIEEGNLHKSLLASSTVYPAFKPVKIEGRLYIDGGFQDNLPINLAIKMGAEEIFAVDLKAVGLKKKITHSNALVTILQPSRPMGSILLFDKELARKNCQLGYLDTLRFFGKLNGKRIFFKARDYRRHFGAIQESFYACINQTLSDQENDFIDLFRVFSNLFLFKKSKIDSNVDRSKFLLHAIDRIAYITGLDDLAIYTFDSFVTKARQVIDDFENQSADLKQLRKYIIYIKNALRKGKINPLFYLSSMTNPDNALAAFLVVAVENSLLTNTKALHHES